MDPWLAIESETGWTITDWVRLACTAPKLVTISEGRELFAAGTEGKERMEWGAFEENDIGWYLQGNQLDPGWYVGKNAARMPIYEYRVLLQEPTRAVMSKVATQAGAAMRNEPSKFQYDRPVGFGNPTRTRLLGYIEADGRFVPITP